MYKLFIKLNKFFAYRLDAENAKLFNIFLAPITFTPFTTLTLSGVSENIFDVSNIYGFLAIILAAVNIFGGFLVTQRMLQMYKKKKKK